MKKILKAWGTIPLLALVVIAGLVFVRERTQRNNLHGLVITPAMKVDPFTLVNMNSQNFSWNSTEGYRLVFFGYTHCPDICPVTLAGFQQINKELGVDASKVQYIFVTVDPKRDTPDVLRMHLDHFDAPIIGLTGEVEILMPVWKQFGVAVEAETDTGDQYEVGHSTRIYLINPEGSIMMTYPYDMAPGIIAEDLIQLVKDGGSLD